MPTTVRSPDRYAGVALAVRLIALIRRKAKSRAELAESLGVHERTIRRLIEALRAGGIQIDQAREASSRTLRYLARS